MSCSGAFLRKSWMPQSYLGLTCRDQRPVFESVAPMKLWILADWVFACTASMVFEVRAPVCKELWNLLSGLPTKLGKFAAKPRIRAPPSQEQSSRSWFWIAVTCVHPRFTTRRSVKKEPSQICSNSTCQTLQPDLEESTL